MSLDAAMALLVEEAVAPDLKRSRKGRQTLAA